VGVTTSDFQVNSQLSRQDQVWCINLKSGDVLANTKWKQYYDLDQDEEETSSYWESSQHFGSTTKSPLGKSAQGRSGEVTQTIDMSAMSFKQGSIVGVLVDQDRGSISYFKDGEDLGIAVQNKELCVAELYPFI